MLSIFLVSLLIVSVLIAVIAAPIIGYYTYARPMMDYEIEYITADFHNHAIGTGAAYGAMRNVTLLDDTSIDVDFAPSPYDSRFQNTPHFEYSRNIKAGQTFVVGCTDYEGMLESSKRWVEESEQLVEEHRQKLDESDLEMWKQNLKEAKQSLEELKQNPDQTYVNMLKYTGVKSLEENPAYEFPSDRFKDRHLEYVERLDGASTLEFFHFSAMLSSQMPCDYPNVIEWSIDIIQTDGREDREFFHRAVMGLEDVQ